MIPRLRKDLLILHVADYPDIASWLERHAGQAFRLREIRGDAYFRALGPEDEALRAPINITSKTEGALRLISNFAHTPFVLDGRHYESVEGFWQGLKFPEEERRRAVAKLHGAEAKRAAQDAPKLDTIAYAGATVRVGAWDHWRLMKRANLAKFDQHFDSRAALLSTGERPLEHRVRPDSRTIPGVIMAEIWMQCRARLRKRASQEARAAKDAEGPVS